MASGQATNCLIRQTTKHAHLPTEKKETNKETKKLQIKEATKATSLYLIIFNKLAVGGLGLEPAGGMLCAIHLKWHFLKVA